MFRGQGTDADRAEAERIAASFSGGTSRNAIRAASLTENLKMPDDGREEVTMLQRDASMKGTKSI